MFASHAGETFPVLEELVTRKTEALCRAVTERMHHLIAENGLNVDASPRVVPR